MLGYWTDRTDRQYACLPSSSRPESGAADAHPRTSLFSIFSCCVTKAYVVIILMKLTKQDKNGVDEDEWGDKSVCIKPAKQIQLTEAYS